MSQSGHEDINLDDICVRCKKPVKTGLKCRICKKLSHNSCLKMLRNVKYYKDGSTICCDEVDANIDNNNGKDKVENGDEINDKNERESETPIELVTPDNTINADKITIRFLEELIKQKDLTIRNQEIAIKALDEQVQLLKEVMAKPKPNNSKSLSDTVVTTQKHGKQYQPPNTTETNNSISNSNLSSALHSTISQNICNEVINLGKSNTSEQKPKNNRSILIGTGSNPTSCPFKAASPRLECTKNMKSYHATNFDPATDLMELSAYLKGFAPNVIVEKLNARMPQSYASFKINVPDDESQNILDSNIWPSEVVLNLFLYSKRFPRNSVFTRSRK